MMDNVVAAILAGGLGTRLRSVVPDRPKVLAEVRGRPFLTYVLDQLVEFEVKWAVLCVGYLGTQVQEAFGNSYGELNLIYSYEPSPLGTAGALRLALPLLRSEPVLVMNGDSIFQTDLKDFWNWHCSRGSVGTLLLTEVSDTGRYGRVGVDGEGHVLCFDEKISQDGSGWINAGVYLLSHRLLETILDGQRVSLEREVFPPWIGQGLYGCRAVGRFLDIGTPESFAMAERFLTIERGV